MGLMIAVEFRRQLLPVQQLWKVFRGAASLQMGGPAAMLF
ncbi:hypothetical protein SV7mr_14290 [Stieleria bergensis]|uniref:Uncharacterized protein n=1 Tax=Stieleria bergensis TaxID=2528025 RepID=A0A517SS17_9BACT|nr:hypothetical protein SV7mr_14290 [Planctomycetes bacterium SV_7m_r]